MSDLDDIQKQLAALSEEFANNLSPRIDQIITEVNSVLEQVDKFAFMQTIFRKIHSLTGSAGTFGFNRLSEQSRQLELMVKSFIDNHTLWDDQTNDDLTNGLKNLHQLIDDGPDVTKSLNIQASPTSLQNHTERHIYIVEAEPAQGHELCLQLKPYGFKTSLFSSVEDVRQALEKGNPDALLIDIVLPKGSRGSISIASEIAPLHKENIPILFMSARKDWESRLAAVRAGGTIYLEKPLDITRLIEHLDRITQQVPHKPYRVLIIDDALDLAKHYSLVLRQAGMHAEVLNDPSVLLEKMESFRPELILLDVYLPEISGIEIAQVLRQHSLFFSIPIVFLSTEKNLDTQFASLQQGDEFLEKPILDDHLISNVESRVERSRTLNQLMFHDGLTGLLNQITLKKRLEIELARSQRHNCPLSYIMLDIDHFKKVNDRYGHTTGDQILKSLGHLLKQRLRKIDQIGRYGGEEFGIIMPDTLPESAYQVIDKLRKFFSDLTYQSNGKVFSCSFSAGVACASVFNHEKSLIEAADEALYLAKEKGRNLTILHKDCQQ